MDKQWSRERAIYIEGKLSDLLREIEGVCGLSRLGCKRFRDYKLSFNFYYDRILYTYTNFFLEYDPTSNRLKAWSLVQHNIPRNDRFEYEFPRPVIDHISRKFPDASFTEEDGDDIVEKTYYWKGVSEERL